MCAGTSMLSLSEVSAQNVQLIWTFGAVHCPSTASVQCCSQSHNWIQHNGEEGYKVNCSIFSIDANITDIFGTLYHCLTTASTVREKSMNTFPIAGGAFSGSSDSEEFWAVQSLAQGRQCDLSQRTVQRKFNKFWTCVAVHFKQQTCKNLASQHASFQQNHKFYICRRGLYSLYNMTSWILRRLNGRIRLKSMLFN